MMDLVPMLVIAGLIIWCTRLCYETMSYDKAYGFGMLAGVLTITLAISTFIYENHYPTRDTDIPRASDRPCTGDAQPPNL